jgi:hypothetical protein
LLLGTETEFYEIQIFFSYSQEPTNRPYSYPAEYGSEGTCRIYVTLSTAELLDLATMLMLQTEIYLVVIGQFTASGKKSSD